MDDFEEAQQAEEHGLWWHGTSKEAWLAIQEEGVLWGNAGGSYRYTWLTPHREVAEQYGPVLLRVQYRPVGIDGSATDNYGFDPPSGCTCWQFSVFVPIPLEKLKVESSQLDHLCRCRLGVRHCVAIADSVGSTPITCFAREALWRCTALVRRRGEFDSPSGLHWVRVLLWLHVVQRSRETAEVPTRVASSTQKRVD